MTESDRTATPPEHPTRALLRLVVDGSRTAVKKARKAVPESAIVPIGRDAPAGQAKRPRGLPRKHLLMLALAVEVLCLGVAYGRHYRPPGIVVDEPRQAGHVIT